MKNYNEITQRLAAIFDQLDNDQVDIKKVAELNNTAGKIFSAAKIQLAYHHLRKEKPVIHFIGDGTEIEK